MTPFIRVYFWKNVLYLVFFFPWEGGGVHFFVLKFETKKRKKEKKKQARGVYTAVLFDGCSHVGPLWTLICKWGRIINGNDPIKRATATNYKIKKNILKKYNKETETGRPPAMAGAPIFLPIFFLSTFFFQKWTSGGWAESSRTNKKKRRMFSWVPWVCLLFRCAARPGIPPLKYLTKMNINYRQISIRLTSTSHHPLSRCLCGPTDFFVYKKKVIFSSQPKRACSCTKSISFGAEDVFLASFFLCAFSDFQSNFFSCRMRWHQFCCPAVPFDPFSTSNREKVRLTFSDNAIS